MNPANVIAPILAAQGVVILDGALATELERRGADLRDALWSARLLIDDPALIQAVHQDYLLAGADVVTTASYQASFPGFARRGIDADAAAALLRRSVALAAAARDAFWSDPSHRVGRCRPLVAASIGPYGAYLADGSEYRGDDGLSVADLLEFHRPRLAVLAAAGADLFACETIPSLREAEALLRGLEEFPHMSAWLSFSCRSGAQISSGDDFADGVRLGSSSPQVAAVGMNCTAPRFVADLLFHARAAATRPLLAYPNSGEGWDAANRCWTPAAAGADFGDLAATWYAAGARLIGGCCRTGPSDVRQIREVLLAGRQRREVTT